MLGFVEFVDLVASMESLSVRVPVIRPPSAVGTNGGSTSPNRTPENQPVECLIAKCRLAGGYAETAAAATHVAASLQGYEIDKSEVRKGAWHPPTVIRSRLRPGLLDCCAA